MFCNEEMSWELRAGLLNSQADRPIVDRMESDKGTTSTAALLTTLSCAGDTMGRRRGQQVRVPSIQESDIDDESVMSAQPPHHCSNQPGAGAGGRNSQLEKIGNAIQAPARAAGKLKVQNIVPFDEPDNVMAPVAKKKRGGKVPQDKNLSAIVLLAASLVVFLMVVFGMVILMVVLTVSLAAPHMALLMTIRLLKPGLQLSSILVSQSITNQCSGSTIPILNTAIQWEPSVTITPHYTFACTRTEEGCEEADIEEDDVSNKGGDFVEDDDVDNELEGGDFTQDDDADDLMEHEEDFYESNTVMHPPQHGDQTYPGSKQVRHPMQAPNSQDEDSDGAGVAGMDCDYQNNHTTRRTAPKRSNLQSTNKQVPSHLNAPVVPNIDYDILQAHHTKNHRPCSPSPMYLSNIQSHHPKTKHTRTRTSLSSDDSDQQDNLEDLNEVDINNGRCHHTKKVKGAANNHDGTNVGFYPSLWQKLLDFPFPDKEQIIGGTGVCGEVIMEAIIQWQEQKRKLEKGYYPEFKMGMATVVFNNAVTFHSKIKQIVLTIIPMAYELALSINGNTIESVKLKTTSLLKKQCICRAILMLSSKSLKQFTEFQKTILPAALFLIGTIIRNIIYIYSKYSQVNGTKQTPIEDSETSYHHISTLFDHTNRDAYHGPKLHQMLKSWAFEGIGSSILTIKLLGMYKTLALVLMKKDINANNADLYKSHGGPSSFNLSVHLSQGWNYSDSCHGRKLEASEKNVQSGQWSRNDSNTVFQNPSPDYSKQS
ncbi:hypothetical protein EDD22DRAFT_851630 [Suillus occidentalis]|nr:hypothetical protein EDD22DRAFT_851630 [Suillus occidentalis]